MPKVKEGINVGGLEHLRSIYHRLRDMVEGFNGRVKCQLNYQRLTWQGLCNASIHVSLVLCVLYGICIATYRIGRPELRQSVAFFAQIGIGSSDLG